MTAEDTKQLIAAVENVAEQISNLNATLERFMEIALVELGTGDQERFALRILNAE